MNCFTKKRVELFHLIHLPATSRGQSSPKVTSQRPNNTLLRHSSSNNTTNTTMTGTVHFDVPDHSVVDPNHHHHHSSSSSSSSRMNRPTQLLRPVSMEEADNSVNEIHESLPRKAAVRLYRQISSGFNSRTIRCLLVVSLGLNLIFAILIGIFVGFWQSSRLEMDGGKSGGGGGGGGSGGGGGAGVMNIPTKEQLYSCFPCSEEGVPGLRISVRSQNGVCCTTDSVPGFDSSNKFLQLTRDYVRAHCPDKSGSGSGNHGGNNRNGQGPSAAHLTLNVAQSKKLLKDLPAQQHYLSWNVRDDTGVSFISDDLRYVNGTITIPTTGRYHVYTHLTFDTTTNKLETQQLVVDHSIARISRGSNVYLLLDRVNLLSREIKSSDLEGTFEFRKGDVIKVVVSFPSYLCNLPQTNVFGLFKLVS
ncbi:hypothetical protein ACOMHN_013800 [Nucella lapillus]